MKRAMYQCEAASVAGFIQQLAVSYLGHGYCFFVVAEIPATKDPAKVDAKLISRYGIDISRWSRARRKKAGLANMHYIRFERFQVLVCTHGQHRFFTDEPKFRDARRSPIRFAGHSISLRHGTDGRLHPSVRIDLDEFKRAKAYLASLAKHRSVEHLSNVFASLPFLPYAPVRRQLFFLLGAVNRMRRESGFEPVPVSALRLRRRVVRAFVTKLTQAA